MDHVRLKTQSSALHTHYLANIMNLTGRGGTRAISEFLVECHQRGHVATWACAPPGQSGQSKTRGTPSQRDTHVLCALLRICSILEATSETTCPPSLADWLPGRLCSLSNMRVCSI